MSTKLAISSTVSPQFKRYNILADLYKIYKRARQENLALSSLGVLYKAECKYSLTGRPRASLAGLDL